MVNVISSGGLGLPWRFFLNGSNVQSGYNHAALVVEPHDDSAALGINGGVIGTGDPIPIPAACNDDEGLEGPRLQKMTERWRSCKPAYSTWPRPATPLTAVNCEGRIGGETGGDFIG